MNTQKILLAFLCAHVLAYLASAKDYFVNPDSTVSNPTGLTPATAFKTIPQAKQAVRQFITNGMAEDVTVHLMGGIYPVTETIVFDNADSGKNGFRVTWQAYLNDRPILDGGRVFSSWKNSTNNGGAVKMAWNPSTNAADTLNTSKKIRNVWVNGERKPWPTTATYLPDPSTPPAQRKDSPKWHKDPSGEPNGILVPADLLPASVLNPSSIELTWNIEWRHHRLPVKSLATAQNGEVVIYLQDAPLRVAVNAPQSATYWPSPQRAFRIENVWERRAQGTWYHSKTSGILYYWPTATESTEGMTAVAPLLDGSFIRIKGATPATPVTGLSFKGLTFRHSNLDHSNRHGVLNVQAGKWLNPLEQNVTYHATGFLPPGAIHAENASDIAVVQNVFERLGTAGVVFSSDVANSEITSNIFRDISESAISLGHWKTEDVDAISAPHHITVDNNLIEGVGAEYSGAPAITAYFIQDCTIRHNEIYNAPYSGIAVGWGWGGDVSSAKRSARNLIEKNHVQHYMTKMLDGGGIYTLGNQPDQANGSVISGNYLVNMQGRWGAIYPDQGSSWWNINNNVVEDFTHYWLHIWKPNITNITASDNWTTSDSLENKGISCTVESTTVVTDPLEWPPAGAAAIIAEAGLRERNLARDIGASATALSSWVNYDAENARDGNRSTIWSAAKEQEGRTEHWTLDLGAARRIKRIEVFPRLSPPHPDTCRNIEVIASNDPTFSASTPQVLGTVDGSGNYTHQGIQKNYSATSGPWVMEVSPDVPYRYIRVRKTVAKQYLTLAEVEVTGW